MVDFLSLALMIIGGVITFGSKYLVKILKIEEVGMKEIIIKLVGLFIAAAGCLRVLDII